MSTTLDPNAPCPCSSGKTFAACCGALLAGQRTAATAEELMRSRYTAHVVNDDAYLHRTYAVTARRPFKAETEGMPPLAWTKLVVHAHEPGPTPDSAFVDFTAFYREGDTEQTLQEKAEFRRMDGQWLYTRAVRQGPPPLKSSTPKVGRNDPCPCGSGKKFKQCCLGKA